MERRNWKKRREWTLEYNRKNADRIREYHRKYRAEHREQIKEAGRRGSKKYITAHRAEHNDRARVWRQTHPERAREIKQASRERHYQDRAWLELQHAVSAIVKA